MKIKGVTGGKNRGNPIEFETNEKAPLVLQDAIPTKAPEGELWYAENVAVSNLQVSSMGQTPKGFANNVYVADGEVEVRRLKTKGDKLLPKQKRKFHVEFKDCLDATGMPDLEVVKLDLM